MDRRPESCSRDMVIRRGLRVRRGVSFDVATDAEPSDPISRELSLGVFPPLCRSAFELMDVLTPKGGRVLDLGAHIGTFSLAAAASGRSVVAVEPAPGNVAVLHVSRVANPSVSLKVVKAADRRPLGRGRLHPSRPIRPCRAPAESRGRTECAGRRGRRPARRAADGTASTS